MKYSVETEEYLARCKGQGFNIWPMLAIFKRRSKINQEIPDEVISSVCKEYLINKKPVKVGFPYFLKVLENKSREYFAKKNVQEHLALKKEQMAFKDILKEILK